MKFGIHNAMIVVTFCGAIGAMPGHSANPYDGAWTGHSTISNGCATATISFAVKDGTIVDGVAVSPFGPGRYLPAKIDPPAGQHSTV